jgi:hypothetical protein
MNIDEIMAEDLDDLLTFKMYLSATGANESPTVAAIDAVAACDALIARLSVQRWIAVRGATSQGIAETDIDARRVAVAESAREHLRSRIAQRS